MPTLPPQEIIDKQDELRKRIEDGTAAIVKMQSDVQQWKDALKAIDQTVAVIYGETAKTPVTLQTVVNKAVADVTESKRRRINYEEYKKLVMELMADKNTVRSFEIKAYISKAVGFPVTDDMVSVAMHQMVKDESTNLIKLQRGLFMKKPIPAPAF